MTIYTQKDIDDMCDVSYEHLKIISFISIGTISLYFLYVFYEMF